MSLADPSPPRARSIIFEPTSEDEDTSTTISKIATYLQEVESRQAALTARGETQIRTHRVTSTSSSYHEGASVQGSVQTQGELQAQLAQCRMQIRGKDVEIAQMQSTLETERSTARTLLAQREAETARLRAELNTAEERLVSRNVTTSHLPAEHSRLQDEYNNLLHSSLALQREVSQLRTELIEQKSRDTRDSRSREREERWNAAKSHQIEIETLQQRIEHLSEEHQTQVAKLHNAAVEDREELLVRLQGAVDAASHAALQARLAERDKELNRLHAKYDDLVEDTKNLVSGDVLSAAEEEIQAHTQHIHRVTADLQALEHKCGQQSDELVALRKAHSELQAKATRLQALNAQLENEIAHNTQKTHADHQDLSALRDKYELVNRFLVEKERVVEKLQHEAEVTSRSESEKVATIDAVRREKAQVEERVVQANDLVAELRGRVEEERRAAEAVKTRVAVLETELDTQTSKMVAQQKESRHAEDAGALQLHTEQERNHLLCIEIDKVSSDLDHARQDLRDTLLERERIDTEKADLAEKLKSSKADAEAQSRRLHKSQESIQQLQTKLKASNESLKAANEKIQSHKKHFDDFVRPALSHAKKVGLL